MNTPVYCSKVQFDEICPYVKNNRNRRILLNIPEKELSLQVYQTKFDGNVIIGEQTITIQNTEFKMPINKPAVFVRNGHTQF